jgi:hypothetical protein
MLIPGITSRSESFCVIKCIIGRYFPLHNTDTNHQLLIEDIRKCFTHFGAVSIYETKDLSQPHIKNKVMQATAIIDYYHTEKVVNENDLNNIKTQHNAVIHYIATNPTYPGLNNNHYISALFEKIKIELLATKPKISKVYIVTKSVLFDTIDSDVHNMYTSFGFNHVNDVTIDGKTTASCELKHLTNRCKLHRDYEKEIGEYFNVVWRPKNFDFINVKKCKDGNGIFTHHKHLGIKPFNEYASVLTNTNMINEINAAIVSLDSDEANEFQILNTRPTSRSMVNHNSLVVWEISCCLLDKYDNTTPDKMRQNMSFNESVYYDLTIFGKGPSTLYRKLKEFNYEVKRPIYPSGHPHAGSAVTREDYKSVVMNAKEGLFVCMITDSNKNSTHVIGIDAFVNVLLAPSIQTKPMPVNEETLTKCCGNLTCIGFYSVGVIYLH